MEICWKQVCKVGSDNRLGLSPMHPLCGVGTQVILSPTRSCAEGAPGTELNAGIRAATRLASNGSPVGLLPLIQRDNLHGQEGQES